MENGYIYISNNIFPTLFAISEAEQQRGLMGQEWPPPIMSFIYTEPRINKFWMHNTQSPLDIVFCHQGKVSRLHWGQPFSTAMIGDNKFSDLIVEFPAGTVERNQIKIGHYVGIVKPTPEQLRKIIAEKYHLLIKF
jgi:uncharacterized membrane protein (UPF0127 family)